MLETLMMGLKLRQQVIDTCEKIDFQIDEDEILVVCQRVVNEGLYTDKDIQEWLEVHLGCLQMVRRFLVNVKGGVESDYKFTQFLTEQKV